eukprot:scaffold436_cov62-Phaeocystis_antarctica.AAC.4
MALWQRSCGAHAVPCSRSRKQASRWGLNAAPTRGATFSTHLPRESNSTRDCNPTCVVLPDLGQKHRGSATLCTHGLPLHMASATLCTCTHWCALSG